MFTSYKVSQNNKRKLSGAEEEQEKVQGYPSNSQRLVLRIQTVTKGNKHIQTKERHCGGTRESARISKQFTLFQIPIQTG